MLSYLSISTLYNVYCVMKRNPRIRVYGFLHIWQKLQPCFLIGGYHWIRKSVIIWLHRKGGGVERHPLLYLKCRAKCSFILEYLLCNGLINKTITLTHIHYIQTAKKVLMSPKCDKLLWCYLIIIFFWFFYSNTGLFSIAACQIIALNLFGISSLLLF